VQRKVCAEMRYLAAAACVNPMGSIARNPTWRFAFWPLAWSLDTVPQTQLCIVPILTVSLSEGVN
jgi:hypothetical protein